MSRHVFHFLEIDTGNKARGLPGMGNLGVQLVHLLQTQPFGLIDEEVHEEGANNAKTSYDTVSLKFNADIACGTKG